MATHKSAKKRIRQNEKKRLHNRGIKSTVRTLIKKVRSATEEKNTEVAKESFLKAEKAIAQAAAKNLYHKKNASRKISRLAKLVNA